MPTATESRSPLPSLLEWSAYCAKAKVELTSHAICHNGKVVLIDPIAAGPTVESALQKMGLPVLIILTNGNHERDAAHWKKHLHIPVAASAFSAREFSFKPDAVLETSPYLHGIQPIPLPGAAPGEHALWVETLKLLLFGDAVIHLQETGLARLPEKYCSDPRTLDHSLKALTRFHFDHVAFAHGSTLVHHASKQMQPILGGK